MNPSNRSKFEVWSFCHELSTLGVTFESEFFFFFLVDGGSCKDFDYG